MVHHMPTIPERPTAKTPIRRQRKFQVQNKERGKEIIVFTERILQCPLTPIFAQLSNTKCSIPPIGCV